jgi:hypothetical protein
VKSEIACYELGLPSGLTYCVGLVGSGGSSRRAWSMRALKQRKSYLAAAGGQTEPVQAQAPTASGGGRCIPK